MAKQNFPTGNSKGNDSDSWGKLASDLLGIQFGGIDDNFDLPDEIAVSPKVVAQETSPPSGSSVPVEEPDLSFSDDEVESSSEEVVIESNVEVDDEPEPVRASSSDTEDDFWGQLENWNWEEPAKSGPRSKSESGERRGGDRSRGQSSGRGSRGEKESGHDRRSDRGSRKDEPRRTDAPRREEQPRQGEPRHESRMTEKPAVSSGEQRENRPPRASEARRSHQVNPATSADADDGFGAGLDDQPSRDIAEAQAVSNTRSSQKKSSPPPARHVDDFAVDLFQEVGAAVGDDEDVSEEKAEARGESDSDDRPRRRRRRRRGGRGRRPEGASHVVENESETNSDIPEGEEDSAEFSEVDSASAQPVEAAGSPAVGDEERESDSSPRPRRRRRRGRRRSEDREPEGKILEDLPREDIAEDSAERKSSADTTESNDAEELFTPVNYEGIPTWEEAISYLVRSRNPDTRGRSHGGQRGRSGPSHRR